MGAHGCAGQEFAIEFAEQDLRFSRKIHLGFFAGHELVRKEILHDQAIMIFPRPQSGYVVEKMKIRRVKSSSFKVVTDSFEFHHLPV